MSIFSVIIISIGTICGVGEFGRCVLYGRFGTIYSHLIYKK